MQESRMRKLEVSARVWRHLIMDMLRILPDEGVRPALHEKLNVCVETRSKVARVVRWVMEKDVYMLLMEVARNQTNGKVTGAKYGVRIERLNLMEVNA